MKAAVVLFPGSNCENDTFHALKNLSFEPYFLWHKETEIHPSTKLIIIPGGFSYGDYLRCGAIASHSPIMCAIKTFADNGGLVMGICNGFQVLIESGLLPGSLQINRTLDFRCHDVFLKCSSEQTPFTKTLEGRVMKMPIAHFEGNYFADDSLYKELEKNGQIAFRYVSPDGQEQDHYNPNGARGSVAGVLNRNKNVLGLMPHPERASEEIMGSTDGKFLFESILAFLREA